MAEISRLPGPVADLWDWQLRGACREADPDLVLPPRGRARPGPAQPRRGGQGGLRDLPGADASAASTRWRSASPTACGAA